ncbi:MAG: response regulator [Deltaproteobacteria bacterium]|nr:response regulator [Deltaproteobacteria bacterium]
MADELEKRNIKLKARESALKESEERYRSVVENVQEGLCIVDTEEVLQFVNPAFSKLLGVDADKIVGMSLDGFVDKETFARFKEGTQDRLRGIDERYEVVFRRPDGKLRDVDLHATPLYSADGSYYGTLGLAVDITERKRLEGHLVQVQKMEAIGTLAGGIAHDFNNILGGILGYASLLKMSLEPGTKERRYIDQVEKAGNRAAELTAQLLAFSRKGKYEVGPVNVLQLIEKILTLFSRTIDKSIKVTTSLQEDLMTEGDRHQLEQAIMGVCINAVQALEERGEKREEGWAPTLTIETKEAELDQAFCQKNLGAKPGKYVLVSVTDTGAGMDQETLGRMFEPFFTTKEVGEGTGLGLSMVYGIVKNHGGYVDVYSELGQGTTLSVYLPIMVKKEKEEKSKEKLEEQVIAGSETILVVDDEDVVREAMKEMLESVGYKVLAAINGKEAVDLYQLILDNNEKVDLVILDMNMPVMGGREAFHQMKRLNPNVRVLLATGLGRSADAHAMLDNGVAGFVYKPFSMAKLSQKVREILEGGRDERI